MPTDWDLSDAEQKENGTEKNSPDHTTKNGWNLNLIRITIAPATTRMETKSKMPITKKSMEKGQNAQKQNMKKNAAGKI